uniref:Uncharacterized protein n=1 Tax=viral metagenome TaxID=1070528 RepID=A0A6C0HA61_9ZZZZ
MPKPFSFQKIKFMLTKLCSHRKFLEKSRRALCFKMTKKSRFLRLKPPDFQKWTYQKCPFLLFPITFD